MSILTDDLPTSVFVEDQEYQVNWDTLTHLQIDELISSDLPEEEKAVGALVLFYGSIPDQIDEAVTAMIRFFKCEKDDEKEQIAVESGSPARPDFSYEHDAPYIYAAFLDQYDIGLPEIKSLHWWEFRALFDSLKSDHRFSEIRLCRSIKLTRDMSKEQKSYYKAMKKLYALPLPKGQQKKLDALTDALINRKNVMEVLRDDEG